MVSVEGVVRCPDCGHWMEKSPEDKNVTYACKTASCPVLNVKFFYETRRRILRSGVTELFDKRVPEIHRESSSVARVPRKRL
jgi:hypothetical protein